ncbi:nitroreductase family protein [Paenibacillus aestuarii]|uniref:Nitroreductase family protein n=1 Tax=Paenibacillus aestuarii TaxID=516965 RepID=A0ABW0K1G3_9BACL|nr:nitroreductase family protein [Paenibacillus aestuarii]
MTQSVLEAVKVRRTYYGLSKETVTSNERIQEIVRDAVKYTPSAFNSQSARAVVLFGAQSDKLWDITTEELRKIVPADSFGPTADRMKGFSAGSGTILFFEDQKVVETLQEQFPAYAANFPIWSNQSSGMLQLVIWTALEQEGLGASLQHYNPLIDDEVKKTWNLPSEWKLIAQMPFGKPTFQPNPKEFQMHEQDVRVFS